MLYQDCLGQSLPGLNLMLQLNQIASLIKELLLLLLVGLHLKNISKTFFPTLFIERLITGSTLKNGQHYSAHDFCDQCKILKCGLRL
jgi:hypothetical protein